MDASYKNQKQCFFVTSEFKNMDQEKEKEIEGYHFDGDHNKGRMTNTKKCYLDFGGCCFVVQTGYLQLQD